MTQDLVLLRVDCTDTTLDAEEQERLVQRLFRELKNCDDIAQVSRDVNSTLPAHSKSIGGFLIGLLTVNMSTANAKKVLQFLGDRFGDKPLKLKVETPEGQKLEIEASSREEFEYIVQQAQTFIEQTQHKSLGA